MSYSPGTNSGHGHVWPRPDGVKARCGGPGICSECAIDHIDMVKSLGERVHNMAREYETDPQKKTIYEDRVAKAWAIASVMKEIYPGMYDRRVFGIACTFCLADIIIGQAKDLDDARLGLESVVTGMREMIESRFQKQPDKADA